MRSRCYLAWVVVFIITASSIDAEHTCNVPQIPGLHEFKCKTGLCIRFAYKCDGDEDCRDGSDEDNCEGCSAKQFKCISGGGCIPQSGVCNLTADCLDGSDEFNCPGKAPEEKWEEHWHDHRENLTLAHANDNVVFYFDSQTNSSITWPIEIVSKAWTYVKETYWSFQPDPRLFIILHTNSHEGCHVSSYINQINGNGRRNILDCGGRSGSSWDTNSSSNVLTLLTNFGGIAQLAAKGVLQDAGFKICENYMRDIVSYDVYTHVLGQTAVINSWKEEKKSQETNDNNYNCFRDWALPIYEKYGGPLVLERFYSLTNFFGTRAENRVGFKYFNMAQFIHFWSGAAQADLTSLAYTAFEWFDDAEMKEVRSIYHQFPYPVTIPNATTYWNISVSSGISKNKRCGKKWFKCGNGKCVLRKYVCDRDNDCGDLSDEVNCTLSCLPSSEFTCTQGDCVPLKAVCNSTEECADGSDEWNCAGKTPEATWREHWHDHRENLTLVHSDEHVVVYYDLHTNSSITWPFSPLSDAWKHVKETYGSFGPDPRLFVILHTNVHKGSHINTFIYERHGQRNVIDWGLINGQTWDNGITSHMKDLLTTIGHVIRAGAKGVIQNADETICGQIMREILSYDVYLHVRGEEEILPWKNEKLNETWNSRFCFKNWLLPIYETYGGASVLNNFYSLTFLYGKRDNDGIDFESFSMQEFIHFWSGAAGADLTPLANTSFGWTNDCEMILTRKKYPEIVYPLSHVSVTTPTIPTPPRTSPPTQTIHNTVLSQTHSTNQRINPVNSPTVFLSITVSLLIAALIVLGVKYYRLKKYSIGGPKAGNMFSISWSTLPWQRFGRTSPRSISRLDPDADPNQDDTVNEDTLDNNSYIRIV